MQLRRHVGIRAHTVDGCRRDRCVQGDGQSKVCEACVTLEVDEDILLSLCVRNRSWSE
jgi:hypothetical protein